MLSANLAYFCQVDNVFDKHSSKYKKILMLRTVVILATVANFVGLPCAEKSLDRTIFCNISLTIMFATHAYYFTAE